MREFVHDAPPMRVVLRPGAATTATPEEAQRLGLRRLLVVSGIVVAALGLSLFTAQLGCTPPSGNWSATSLTACRRSRISPSAASTSPAGCSNLMYLAVFVSPGPQ